MNRLGNRQILTIILLILSISANSIPVQATCRELLWARRCEGWSNPKWHDYIERCKTEAAAEGHPNHMWIYSLWDMNKILPHI